MTEVIDGQLDLLELLAPAPEPPDEEPTDLQMVFDLHAWDRAHGFVIRGDRQDDPLSVYPGKAGPRTEGTSRPRPQEPLQVHFSGYAIPPYSTQTVAEAEAFYLPKIAEAEEKGRDYEGYPISGDQTARWRRFQGPNGWLCTPYYRDIWPVLYGAEPPASRSSIDHPTWCKADHPAMTQEDL